MYLLFSASDMVYTRSCDIVTRRIVRNVYPGQELVVMQSLQHLLGAIGIETTLVDWRLVVDFHIVSKLQSDNSILKDACRSLPYSDLRDEHYRLYRLLQKNIDNYQV
jgi:hypothetical protein